MIKIRKTVQGVMTMALAIIMYFYAVIPAFATGGPVTGGTEEKPVQASITKDLKVSDGAVASAETFIFTAQRVSVDGDASASALSTAPALNMSALSISYNQGISGIKEGEDLFENVTFPHAGEYVYTIKETAGITAGKIYSDAEYTLTVYVKNGVNGVYVYGVSAVVVEPDNENQDAGDKVDPTPDSKGVGLGTGIVFTNTYVPMTGNPDPEEGAALVISKIVDGDYGDRSKYFEFEMTLIPPSVISGTSTYKAYVIDNTGVVTSTDNYKDTIKEDIYGKYFSVESTESVTFYLKHGQELSVAEMEVGATYSLTEASAANYIPEVLVTVNGGTPYRIYGTLNNSLQAVDSEDNPNILIGSSVNRGDFTNARNNIMPTGILINNMPYIVMLLLASGTFVIFILIKLHKRRTCER
jgi:pilin isopeptide linkage protein